jgi:translocator protein
MTFSLLIFIVLCLACGGLGGWVTAKSVRTWYPTLARPRWTPPDGIFGPVWTTLYVLMAISAWMVWERLPQGSDYSPMVLFGFQLLLNTTWSIIFFGLRRPGWAMVDIIFLWIFIGLTTLSFWNVYWLSGVLFLPYFLWVSFAVILNAAFVKLN